MLGSALMPANKLPKRWKFYFQEAFSWQIVLIFPFIRNIFINSEFAILISYVNWFIDSPLRAHPEEGSGVVTWACMFEDQMIDYYCTLTIAPCWNPYSRIYGFCSSNIELSKIQQFWHFQKCCHIRVSLFARNEVSPVKLLIILFLFAPTRLYVYPSTFQAVVFFFIALWNLIGEICRYDAYFEIVFYIFHWKRYFFYTSGPRKAPLHLLIQASHMHFSICSIEVYLQKQAIFSFSDLFYHYLMSCGALHLQKPLEWVNHILRRMG